MNRFARLLLCPLFAFGLSASLLVWPASAQDTKTQEAPKTKQKSKAPKAPPKWEAADVPNIKGEPGPNNSFVKRHEGFLKDKEKMQNDVGFVLLGDSITDGWRTDPEEAAKKAKTKPLPGEERGGKKVYDKQFSQYKPLNLGIGGDRTQHVLWRIDNGEIDGIHPKALMLMIGTNNLAINKNEEIAKADAKIVQEIRQKLPDTKILLLGIFPRGKEASDPNRQRIKDINAELAKLDDGQHVKYLDIGDKFLQPDGTLPKEIMPDALHPNAKGYQIWADAVGPTLAEMMK